MNSVNFRDGLFSGFYFLDRAGNGLPVASLILAFLVLFISLEGYRGVGQASSFELTGTAANRNIDPGDLTTVTFTLTNKGEEARSYRLEVSLPEGWKVLGNLSKPELPGGSSKTVFVSFTVPGSARAGDYEVKLNADPSGLPEDEKQAVTLVTVSRMTGLSLQADTSELRASPGKRATFHLRISNTGNVLDKYSISTSATNDWPVSTEVGTIELLPGRSKQVGIAAVVPEGAKSGDQNRLTVTVKSESGGGKGKQVALKVDVVPPEPEEVTRELYPSIPAEFTATSFVTESGSSSIFSLSASGVMTPELELSLDGRLKNFASLEDFSLGVTGNRGALNLSYEESKLVLTGLSLSTGFPGPGEASGDLSGSLELSLVPGAEKAQFGLSNKRFAGEVSLLHETESTGGSDVFSVALSSGAGDFSPGAEISGGYRHVSSSEGTEAQYDISVGLGFGGSSFGLSSSWYTKNYSNEPGDELDLSASFIYSPSESILSSSFASNFNWSGLGSDAYGVKTRSNRVGIGLSPEAGPALDFSFTNVSVEGDTVSGQAVGEARKKYFAGVSGAAAQLSYEAAYSYRKSRDRISGRQFAREKLSAGMGVTLDPVELNFGLKVSETINLKSGKVEEEAVGLEFGARLASEAGMQELSAESSRGSTGFFWSLDREGTNVFDTLEIGFDLAGEELNGSLDFGGRFRFPVVPVKSKGQLKGRVYVDENGNGRLDPGETGEQGLLLEYGDSRAVTDEKGFFVFPPSWPGTYDLRLDNLPLGYKVAEEPGSVGLEAGATKMVSLPLSRFSILSGTLFLDKNENGNRDGEPGISNVEVSVSGPEGTIIKSGPAGEFRRRLPKGSYRLEVVKSSLPEGYELGNRSEVQVVLKPGRSTRVEFGLREKKKPVLFAPTVKYQYEPKEPAPDQVVTFDASRSQDFDGNITGYEWSFADGSTAGGKMVKHQFGKAGKYSVKLVVTDDDGQKGQLTKTVTVKE